MMIDVFVFVWGVRIHSLFGLILSKSCDMMLQSFALFLDNPPHLTRRTCMHRYQVVIFDVFLFLARGSEARLAFSILVSSFGCESPTKMNILVEVLGV
mmetsp:Transcript_23065/g.57283  ORF Transcript_23065/g.57283 Transcript_23065/m.57283 type:complete len:98 (+) Transcript_23065:17-310(+)